MVEFCLATLEVGRIIGDVLGDLYRRRRLPSLWKAYQHLLSVHESAYRYRLLPILCMQQATSDSHWVE